MAVQTDQTVACNKVLDKRLMHYRPNQASTRQRKMQTIYTHEGNGEQMKTIRNQGAQSVR